MLSFIDREDLIVLIKSRIRESVIKREFGITDEEYNSLLKSIDIRKKLQETLEQKDSNLLQKLIKKYRKKDCLVEYVACFTENREAEFFKEFDAPSKARFKSLLEEYNISLERTKKDNTKPVDLPHEEFKTKLDARCLSDDEIENFRKKAERGSINQKNIFAFMLYKSGRVDESRDYLLGLIDAHKSYYAFRQIIHLEKEEGNIEDAKFWILEAEEQFPNNVGLKEVKFRIARKEQNIEEMFEIAREIRRLTPGFDKYEKEAQRIKDELEEK